MAINFTNIGLAQPSTVTHRVRTVQIPMGSTNEQQELLSLADPESSAGVLRVVDVAPDSTHFGAVVRQVGYVAPSTTINVSSLAGLVSVNLQSTASVRVTQSSAADLNVTVAGYSTTVNVSSLAGRVSVAPSDTNWASSAGFHFDSSGALLTNGGGTAGSTTVNVSSLAGRVSVAPSDTNWASSAGFHFDSSGALQIVGTFSASTGVTVNRMVGNSSAADYMPVRIVDSSGTGFLNPGNEYTSGSTYSSFAGPTLTFDNSSNNTYRGVGLTTPWPVQITDSSNTAVKPGDAVNNAVRVNVVAGSAASTTVNVSSLAGRVSVAPSDTNWASSAGFHFDSSGALQIAGTLSASTVVTVSTGSVRVHQSSAADLNVTVAGYVAPSTTVSVSTGSVRVHQSSAADLNVTVAGYSTTMNVSSLAGVVQTRLQDSSGVDVIASTSQPPAGANGLAVRQAFGSLLSTTVFLTSSNSTALYDLVSSAANVRHKVFAYFVASTHTTPSTLVFVSSNGSDKWAVAFGSGSSGVTGANLAVAPPGWLFQSAANEALRCRIENTSTQVLVRLSFSYFSEA